MKFMPTSRWPGNLTGLTTRAILVVLVVIGLLLGGSVAGVHASTTDPGGWLYLRDGQALAADEDPLQLLVVGDIMLGRGVAASPNTLAQVTPELQKADLTLGNFEGVIAPPGQDPVRLSKNIPGEPYKLVMGRHVPDLLQDSGFDLVSLANNHALDLESSGLVDTIDGLESAGLQVFGVSGKTGETESPLYVDRKGLRTAFLAFTMIPPPSIPVRGPVPARYDPQASFTAVASARQKADIVVVLLHAGVEYDLSASLTQENAAQNLAQAGADLVIGSHPHVVQGTQVIYPDITDTNLPVAAFIAYSLGNFVFDQYNPETLDGLALRIDLDNQGLRAVQALPLRAGSHPRWLAAAQADKILQRVEPAQNCADQPAFKTFTCNQDGCQPGKASEIIGNGPFQSGEIDLTGDGKPEQISLASGKVEVVQDGKVVWQSPDAWNVLDLALGDPNDDGRYEMLLSLRKADASGALRSHPFIIGYRGGIYRQLWGGSELSTPITEVELGDVDGDGAQELVVLEEQQGGMYTVSVWNWHGWGFVLDWRSAAGSYQNLHLMPEDSDSADQIQVDHGCTNQPVQ